jgi:hypothetical protein
MRPAPRQSLPDYHTATGNPPGRWTGAAADLLQLKTSGWRRRRSTTGSPG